MMKLSLSVFVALVTPYILAETGRNKQAHAHNVETTRQLSSALLKRYGECSTSADCATGGCCSQHGYCGNGPEYCVAGGRYEVQASEHSAGDITNSDEANGSIYKFVDANECHQIFRETGACGISTYFPHVPTDSSFVAMPAGYFDQYGSAQHNTLCGKTITIMHNGVTRTAVVADRNLSDDNSIDMCLDLWTAFGGHYNDGTLLRSVSFHIAD